MTWRTTLCCLLAVAWAVPAAAAQSKPVRSDQEVLVQIERDWDAALRNHDVAFIDGILADDFVVTYDDGTRADRAEELAQAASFNQHIDSSTQDEFMVKEYGNTAIVWFTLHLVGPSNGQTLALNLRFTDVYVLQAGRWKCVSSHSTRIIAP
jgi:ketosteroid isomerase-like protein